MPDPGEVRSMFGRIAGRYDFLNRTLSLGIDRRWRRACVEAAGDLRGRVGLDACCGTGDLSLAFAGAGARVVGIDFTEGMLQRALPKRGTGGEVVFAQGDALRLPLSTDTVDFAGIAFGARNLADPRAGLSELARVVRPGGRVLVLEFSQPRGRLLGGLFGLYFRRVLPVLGGLVSGDLEAYRYLPRTVGTWPPPEAFAGDMERAGLVEVGYRSLTGGIACLHWGSVPLPRGT